MSSRYPGGVVRKNQLTPTTSNASGMWTIGQAAQATKSDIWPYSGIANPISQSLRFRNSASAYLQRTSVSPTNNKIFTWSGWVKVGSGTSGITGPHNLIDGVVDLDNESVIRLQGPVSFAIFTGGTYKANVDTNATFRDPSAWYHIVVAVDMTQSTNTNGVKIYVNGVQQTLTFSTYVQNSATQINTSSVTQLIAKDTFSGSNRFADYHLTDVNFIDGQQLDSSYFGQTSAITGVWEPKQYSGTYGNNGFHLEFKDTTVGKDTSGNNNHWTPNNISTSSGYTYDLSYDVPVSWTPRDGTSVRGNYCVLNPLTSAGGTLSDAGLSWAPGGNNASIWSTFAVNTGKWYFEMTKGSSGDAFIVFSQTPKFNNYQGDGETTSVGLYMYYNQGSSGENRFIYNSTNYAFPTGFGNDDSGTVYGVTLDFDTSTITVYRNNNDSTKATFSMPSALTASPLHIGYSVTTTWPSGQFYWNFGQRPFAYTLPTGFKSLCSTNLPTPTIGATTATAANKYFNIITYTGTGASAARTGVGFQPDLVWYKSRSVTENSQLFDSVRGVQRSLYSNLSNAEATDPGVYSFDSDGFTAYNSAYTYVAWNWNAGGANTTNTSGTITSTVRANQTAGFSIVNYTGDGTNGRTVGHGLETTPAMIIMKNRLASSDWNVWHKGLGSKGIYLNYTDAAASDNNAWLSFNSTLPGSSVFTVGNGGVTNGGNFIAYCWSEITGYSKFGSYTGNGSTGGPFVYTGFRPKFIMYKRTDSTGGWLMVDSSRNTYNLANYWLQANTNETEQTDGAIDFLSNGYKIRGTGTGTNASGGTYIYMAFAENPFKTALAR